LQKLVALLLSGNLALVPGEHSATDQATQKGRGTQMGKKLLFAALAGCLAVGQEVDQNHW